MGMGQNLVPLVNLKIAGKWMFIPLKMVLIGIDPYPYINIYIYQFWLVVLFQVQLKWMKGHAGQVSPESIVEKVLLHALDVPMAWEDKAIFVTGIIMAS